MHDETVDTGVLSRRQACDRQETEHWCNGSPVSAGCGSSEGYQGVNKKYGRYRALTSPRRKRSRRAGRRTIKYARQHGSKDPRGKANASLTLVGLLALSPKRRSMTPRPETLQARRPMFRARSSCEQRPGIPARARTSIWWRRQGVVFGARNKMRLGDRDGRRRLDRLSFAVTLILVPPRQP